nr:RNA-directed DNA polymerase, eukaryota [Tanacetum cinerariifolium]
MDGVEISETTSKTRLSRSKINSIKRHEKNEAFSKNNGDKTTNSIPSQKADHVGSSQNKKSYASSLNGDRDSKVKKQVNAVKGNTLSNVPLTPSLITPALVLDDSCAEIHDFVSDERVVWVDIEGVPLNVWSRKTFLKIGKKWGETMDIKENLVSSYFKGNVYMARAKELFTWTPIFLDHKESEYISDDESLHGAKDESVGSQHGEDDLVDDSNVEGVSETFFGVAQDSDSSLSHPPGFTPKVSRQENDHKGVDLNTEIDKVNLPLVHTKVMNNSQKRLDFGSVERYDSGRAIYGLRYGRVYEGHCTHHWDTRNQRRSQMNILSLNIQGLGHKTKKEWISNNSKVLIVVIYAPQSLSHKRVLWDYISSLIARWNGETIVMGDFNEVRSIDERFDTNGLIRFKKKIQDLKKIICSWIKDKKLQQSGAINSIKEDLIDIDKNLDSGNVSDEILLKRIELMRQLHDINQMEARDYVQKLKIKWAIEGDENSKFFHGIINKKRYQLSIREVFVDGDWNTDPEVVKDVFKYHFATRFEQPAHGRLKLNISFSNRLSIDQVADMDRSVSRDEIRVAVWNCGEHKSPGLDGSTPLRDIIISELPSCIAITPVLSTEEPKDSLIMMDEHLDIIPEKESDKFIKSSVENLVPNPSESKDASGSDKNIESKDSYDSNLDEPDLLVTPLFDANEDECFDPGGDIDEIDAFLDVDISTDIKNGYHDSEGDIIYLESLLLNDTILNLPPKVFLDHDPRSFKDEPNNYDFKSMVKVFDPEIHDQIFSPTYVSLPFTDHHYLFSTYVVRNLRLYFTYPMVSPLLLLSRSEDTIFDLGISACHFSLAPVAQ